MMAQEFYVYLGLMPALKDTRVTAVAAKIVLQIMNLVTQTIRMMELELDVFIKPHLALVDTEMMEETMSNVLLQVNLAMKDIKTMVLVNV